MNRRILLLSALVCALIWPVVLQAQPAARESGSRRAKYVFLMIGDGMGVCQRTTAERYARGAASDSAKKLAMNTLPAMGLTTTYSANAKVTDSAAAGTALACGEKTTNGVISMGADGKRNLKTMAEVARERGMKVGIITTVSIDHATPAVFYAHQKSRGEYHEIAMQLAASGYEFFAGGGFRGDQPSRRKGRPSPVAAARANGFTIVRTRQELNALRPGVGKVLAFDHPAPSSPCYEMDRTEEHIPLAELTRKAIELLDNPKGFFIMVEGGIIDWACHANDGAASIHDTIAFDAAVAEAVAFCRRRPGESLIVVTADHETGGMGLGLVGNPDPCRFAAAIRRQKMSYSRFKQVLARLRKEKPSFKKALPEIERAFDLGDVAAKDMAELEKAYGHSVLGVAISKKARAVYGRCDPLTGACARLAMRGAGITWRTGGHTNDMVPTTALGVGQARFVGFHDNTDIFKMIVRVMGAAPVAARPAGAALASPTR